MPDPGADEPGLIRLSRNERVEPLPDWFVQRIRDTVTSELFTNYPAADTLYRELSDSLELETDQVLVTAGSDAAIKSVYEAYVRPGDSVVALEPSYAMFAVYAQMFGARHTGIPIARDLEVPGEALLAAIQPGVRLVILANPNQPTGSLIDESVLLEAIERAGTVGALVAVDEAYYPFSGSTALGRLAEHPQLLIIRTFSKAAGLAGLRIGYAAGHPEVILNLSKVRSVNPVSSVAIACALEVVRAPQVIDDYVAEVRDGTRVLAAKAKELGLGPIEPHANFMLIRVAPRFEPRALVRELETHGFLIKGPFGEPMTDCIRVTLGGPALMGRFGEALERSLQTVA